MAAVASHRAGDRSDPLPVMRLARFVADACSQYPILEIELFGSRARGNARYESDWDVIVRLSRDATPDTECAFLADQGLRDHFRPWFLDLWLVRPDGVWLYWVPDHPQHRSWRPDPGFLANLDGACVRVWPLGAASASP